MFSPEFGQSGARHQRDGSGDPRQVLAIEVLCMQSTA